MKGNKKFIIEVIPQGGIKNIVHSIEGFSGYELIGLLTLVIEQLKDEYKLK